MKVFDERHKDVITFADISKGECFIDMEGDLCMRIDANADFKNYYNAVDLETGLLWVCDENAEVTKVYATVTIRD